MFSRLAQWGLSRFSTYRYVEGFRSLTNLLLAALPEWPAVDARPAKHARWTSLPSTTWTAVRWRGLRIAAALGLIEYPRNGREQPPGTGEIVSYSGSSNAYDVTLRFGYV